MQVLQDNFFYHSNSRLGADGGLEHERQLLAEEQKSCRARARKFSLETTRRRKALDERWKQWDVQEQRLRDNILQQRRQQVQDATERFQRAHLPPSQRRRQSFRRHVGNIEDALNQIQGNPFNLSSNTNVSRSCTPSPKPPTVSKSSHRQVLCALEAYTKLLQEQSRAEEQQDDSPQGSNLSDRCDSEILSSKDSLESEEPSHNAKNLQRSFSSFLLDSVKAHPDQRKQNDLCPTSDLTSFSAMMLLGDNLAQPRKQHEPKQKTEEESGWLNNKLHFSKASWEFTSVQKTPKPETGAALHNCNLLTLCEIISGDPEHFGPNSPQNIPSDNIIVTNRVDFGCKALEFKKPKEESTVDIKQERFHDDGSFKYSQAAGIPFLTKDGNSKGTLFGASPKPNIFLNNSTTDNLSNVGTLQKTEKEIYHLPSQKEPRASMNNLNKVSNSEPQTEKPINTALLERTGLSNVDSDVHKCLECPEEEIQKMPESMATSRSVCEVRFIKGILKKQSKYMSGDTTRVFGSGHLIFAKQVALAIRDSVELTRAKTNTGGNAAVKKKLRWFDEVHVEKEENDAATKQMKSKFSSLQSKSSSEDHQLSLTAVSGTPKAGPGVTPAASARYHFTKEAWADVGVQVNLPQERADEVKVARSSARAGGPKVPRRERSARAGAGPVSSRTRKGTVIRPQSATEVSQIAKTQGKVMVPRPPPRTDSAEEKTAYVTKNPYGSYKHAQAAEHKSIPESFFSPDAHHVITADSGVMYTPLPPSYACRFSEGNAKSAPSAAHQDSYHRRRGMAHGEKGLCLDCTPTDEEISQLWHGVRSALTTKDAKTVARRQAPESGRVLRKACLEPSRQPPGSGNRRLLQTSQSTKHSTELVRPSFSSTQDSSFPKEGLERAAQLHLAEVHAAGPVEERDIVAAMETAQTQRSGTVQQRGQQQGLTTISLEEKKILLSLDRLNHQLHCVQEHVGVNTGTHGLVLVDAPYDAKVANQKRRASSANSRPRYQKKY
ncbi:centrosomal protein of 126 kDa [Mugil cephalus]|uniref:centrosomal protein of 126 kDa n=1 Tax=Mugil cephalus TaxID=48193 RepID=UPI001FB649F0|nr:centrosomal protein of 126 kDa [Mugil cephalus]